MHMAITISIIVLAAIIVLLVVVPLCIAIAVYESVFGKRYSTPKSFAFALSDFDGLKAQRYEFSSNKRQKLVGYRYFVSDEKPKGVIIIAHGLGGGGHNSYMDSAYYFASNGYNVFAYDATGNDESGGRGTLGLPQGVIDLNHAINFVKTLPEFSDLPIMLFGHSWGGYSVCNVLNLHPEVKAVVSFSGFNKASDLLKCQGKAMVGGAINLLMPYLNAYESLKFGKFAKTTAMDGFAKSNAGVFVVHSQDDTTVPIQYGYNIFFEKYSNNPRFKFVSYANKGHSFVYCSDEAIAYVNAFFKGFSEHFANPKATAEEKAEYVEQNFDRSVWCNLLNKQLYQEILSFYDNYL